MSNSHSKDGGVNGESIPQNPSPAQPQTNDQNASSALPLWKQLLHQRGLSDSTIGRFQIQPNKDGWVYPIEPTLQAKRWKAFDSNASPKYLWQPKKPDGVKFYDPTGKLTEFIAEADGVLWLAGGEPDVWALAEAGILNATCTLNGEATRLPDWFAPVLQQLGVTLLHVAPDCDDAGLKFTTNVHDALENTGIELVAYQLPFAEKSKGDIGMLLLQAGSRDLRATLETLPKMNLGALCAKPERVGDSSPASSDLFEQWCTEVVEPEALRVWDISAPNGKEFSAKPFTCPFHPDENPSAYWNYRTHGVHCQHCQSHNTHEVAERLGVQPWEDYKAMHAQPSSSRPTGADPLDDEEGVAQYPTWPYGISDEGHMVFYHKTGKGNDIHEELIADFVVRIVDEIICDDGTRKFRLKGTTIYGTPVETTIAAQDMEDGRTLKATLAAVIDPRAAIYPKRVQHLAPAIRKLSTDITVSRNYQRTGWANGTFLIPGREQNGTTLSLPAKLPYRICQDASLSSGLHALDHVIQAIGPEQSLPALVALFQAPLAKLANWRNERYAVFIQGRTGMFKTSWTQTALAIYGPDFALRDDLLIKMGEGATKNAVMALAASAYDLPLLIDNYKPNTGGGSRDFINLVHNLLEGGEKDRLNRNSDLKETRSVFAWPVFTGEDIPDNDPASLARVLIIRLDTQPENASQLLAVAQKESAHLNAVGGIWLDFLEGETGRQQVKVAVKDLDTLRSRYLHALREAREDVANAQRIATNLATNTITWNVLVAHPTLEPVFEPYAAAYQAGIQQIVSHMAGSTAQSLAATRYLDGLRELLASGRYVICARDGSDHNLDRDRVLGYRAPDGTVYLLPDISREAVRKLMGPDALGNASTHALHRQLYDMGYLASRAPDGYTVSRRVGKDNKNTRVLHLKAEALD